MERGTVKFFNNKPEKMFGFIVPDSGVGEVFFHFNNGKMPNPPGWIDWYNVNSTAPRCPKAGDRIVFDRREPKKLSDKGPSAIQWAFEADYAAHADEAFTLHWLSGKTEMVKGSGIADACRKAGIGQGALRALDYYEIGENKVQVAGKATCGCVHHAEEGTSCPHDLELVGLDVLNDTRRPPVWTHDESPDAWATRYPPE